MLTAPWHRLCRACSFLANMPWSSMTMLTVPWHRLCHTRNIHVGMPWSTMTMLTELCDRLCHTGNIHARMPWSNMAVIITMLTVPRYRLCGAWSRQAGDEVYASGWKPGHGVHCFWLQGERWCGHGHVQHWCCECSALYASELSLTIYQYIQFWIYVNCVSGGMCLFCCSCVQRSSFLSVWCGETKRF